MQQQARAVVRTTLLRGADEKEHAPGLGEHLGVYLQQQLQRPEADVQRGQRRHEVVADQEPQQHEVVDCPLKVKLQRRQQQLLLLLLLLLLLR